MAGTALGQSNWDPTDYYGIPEREKSAVFLDEFEDNRNQWNMGSVYLSEKIENSEYSCVSHANSVYTKHRPIDLNLASDFEAEIRIRFIKGMSGDLAGLTFGRDLRGNGFHLIFNSNLQYKISQTENSRDYDIQGWQGTSALRRTHGYNSLMVRQVEGRWYFFVNKELVAQMAAQPLYGTEFGFSLGGHMAVEVDFLRVTHLQSIDQEGPRLTMSVPQVSNGETVVLHERRQVLEGRVQDPSGVSALTINGQDISFSEGGFFRASLMLPPSPYSIEVRAIDRFNNETRQRFVLQYQPEAVPETATAPVVYEPQPSTSSGWDTESDRPSAGFGSSNPYQGDNYLLLIGVNEYRSWNPLHNAVKDCRDLSSTLMQHYWFEPDHVITLYNEDATRERILETLEALQEMIRPEDNLLIYYAGHGYYDQSSGLGYWVPVEARLDKIPDFIRNSTIHDYLRTIESKHTLLIADACYAGSLFAAYRGQIIEGARSRWAFTSGDIEKVWDGKPGQNSPFAHYLIKYLRDTRRESIPANELIDEVGGLVSRNTAQTPKGNPLRLAGDDGGVFIFYRK